MIINKPHNFGDSYQEKQKRINNLIKIILDRKPYQKLDSLS